MDCTYTRRSHLHFFDRQLSHAIGLRASIVSRNHRALRLSKAYHVNTVIHSYRSEIRSEWIIDAFEAPPTRDWSLMPFWTDMLYCYLSLTSILLVRRALLPTCFSIRRGCERCGCSGPELESASRFSAFVAVFLSPRVPRNRPIADEGGRQTMEEPVQYQYIKSSNLHLLDFR